MRLTVKTKSPQHSEAAQLILFQFGFWWCGGNKNIIATDQYVSVDTNYFPDGLWNTRSKPGKNAGQIDVEEVTLDQLYDRLDKWKKENENRIFHKISYSEETKKVEKKFNPLPVKDEFTFTLNSKQCQAVMDILGNVGGSPYNTARCYIDEVYRMLEERGFICHEPSDILTGDIYSLYFKEGTK